MFIRLCIGYVAFAVGNPALFSLMFGGVTADKADANELRVSGKRAYGVLQAAIKEAQLAKGGGDEESETFAGLWCWCGVHGLAKLVIEQKLDPKNFGVPDAEALARRMLELVNP